MEVGLVKQRAAQAPPKSGSSISKLPAGDPSCANLKACVEGFGQSDLLVGGLQNKRSSGDIESALARASMLKSPKMTMAASLSGAREEPRMWT